MVNTRVGTHCEPGWRLAALLVETEGRKEMESGALVLIKKKRTLFKDTAVSGDRATSRKKLRGHEERIDLT